MYFKTIIKLKKESNKNINGFRTNPVEFQSFFVLEPTQQKLSFFDKKYLTHRMTSYEQQSLIVCEEKKKEQQALTCD